MFFLIIYINFILIFFNLIFIISFFLFIYLLGNDANKNHFLFGKFFYPNELVIGDNKYNNNSLFPLTIINRDVVVIKVNTTYHSKLLGDFLSKLVNNIKNVSFL
jgi:hypothetical protein